MSDIAHHRSADGTLVGAEVVGHGRPLLLVHGSTADRSRWAPLVPHLRDAFQLVLLDRRGRGASTSEAQAYALEREGEDVLAVLAALGQDAAVFGHSYGATAVLNVLDRLPASTRVLLYEPPGATDGHVPLPPDLLRQWEELLAAGRREDVLVSFYRDTLGFDEEALARVRALPVWPARIAAVHTIVREGYAVNAFTPRPVTPPARVRFLLGTETAPFLRASTLAAAAAVAGSELAELPGQGHVAIDTAPDLVAAHVREVCGA